MRNLSKIKRKEDGQSLVEFALILPILLLLIVAVIDFGWIFFAKVSMNNAAREGARLYAVRNDKNLAEDRAEAALNNITFSVGPVATATIEESGADPTAYTYQAKVIVTGTVKSLIGIFPEIPELVSLSSVAYMKVEYKYP